MLTAATMNRLEKLLAWVQRRRAQIYPPGWKYDPLYDVEQELIMILQEIRKPI